MLFVVLTIHGVCAGRRATGKCLKLVAERLEQRDFSVKPWAHSFQGSAFWKEFIHFLGGGFSPPHHHHQNDANLSSNHLESPAQKWNYYQAVLPEKSPPELLIRVSDNRIKSQCSCAEALCPGVSSSNMSGRLCGEESILGRGLRKRIPLSSKFNLFCISPKRNSLTLQWTLGFFKVLVSIILLKEALY